jgi:hypothetical protein
MGINDKVQGKTDITTTDGLTEIGILLYPVCRCQQSLASPIFSASPIA